MTFILLIRHATHMLGSRVLAGRLPNILLSPEGTQQTSELTQRLAGLPIEAIYCSPLERTQETAKPLANELGLPINTLQGITELDFGEWSGRSLDELDRSPNWRAWNSFRSGGQTPAGEMMLDVQARAMRELRELCVRHPNQCVAVFTHGDVIRAAIAYCLGVPLDVFGRIQIGLASVSVVKMDEQSVSVMCVNNTGRIELSSQA